MGKIPIDQANKKDCKAHLKHILLEERPKAAKPLFPLQPVLPSLETLSGKMCKKLTPRRGRRSHFAPAPVRPNDGFLPTAPLPRLIEPVFLAPFPPPVLVPVQLAHHPVPSVSWIPLQAPFMQPRQPAYQPLPILPFTMLDSGFAPFRRSSASSAPGYIFEFRCSHCERINFVPVPPPSSIE